MGNHLGHLAHPGTVLSVAVMEESGAQLPNYS